MHYLRWYRSGRVPSDPEQHQFATLDGVIANRTKRTESGCWEWTGALTPGGYGSIGRGDRKGRVAHRMIYEYLVGPVPDGLQLDHLCRNRACVNPAHLEPVTPSLNVRRGVVAEVMKARAVARTGCPNGHAWDAANTWRDATGARHCRRCHRERARARYHRMKAA